VPREFLASVRTIMAKELRSRFRGRRAFGVLTLYLAVLALIAYGAYTVVAPTAREEAQFGIGFDSFGSPNASAQVGQAIFALLSVFQLLLVSVIAPAFTAGAISLEREKQTLDLLIATPMRPGGIVIGKLVSALAFVVLLILAGVPVSALVLMYGGASVDDILRQQVVLFSAAIGFGVIGLFWSALIKRTQTATVLTYTTLLVLTIGSLLVWRFWTALETNDPENLFGEVRTAPEAILYANPAVAMIEIVANTELEFGDFSQILNDLRGGISVECDGDVCFPTPVQRDNSGGAVPDVLIQEDVIEGMAPLRGGGVARLGINGGLELDERGGAGAIQLAVPIIPPAGETAISNHFWPRFTATFAGLSVLLTLASMRLVVPAGTPLRSAAGVRLTP
jgi:ABC-type transport system involved in multi-copper enzyme maturation permease subunit